MRATIIVRHSDTDKIAKLWDVNSVDEVTVKSAVHDLERVFPAPAYLIDTSQVDYARAARQGLAA